MCLGLRGHRKQTDHNGGFMLIFYELPSSRPSSFRKSLEGEGAAEGKKGRKEGRDAEGSRGPGTVGRPKKEEAEEEEAADTSGVD